MIVFKVGGFWVGLGISNEGAFQMEVAEGLGSEVCWPWGLLFDLRSS